MKRKNASLLGNVLMGLGLVVMVVGVGYSILNQLPQFNMPQYFAHGAVLSIFVGAILWLAGGFTDLESRLEGKRIVILKWDAVPVLDAGGLDAFQRFVKRLPEGCELRVCNVEFQPLRTMARAGIQPIPGRLAFFPNRRAAMADL